MSPSGASIQSSLSIGTSSSELPEAPEDIGTLPPVALQTSVLLLLGKLGGQIKGIGSPSPDCQQPVLLKYPLNW